MKEDPKHIHISEYNYPLSDERIAKFPLAVRDQSKLLVYRHGEVSEDVFHILAGLSSERKPDGIQQHEGDSGTPPLPQRNGALIEVFCLEPIQPNDYVLNFQQTEHAAGSA